LPFAIPASYTGGVESETKGRLIARVTLGIAYFIAGVAHIVSPAGFVKITPGWVPWPEQVVLFTGLCEIAGATALLFVPKLRRAAGWAFAAYAVCVYPANVNHALNNIALAGEALGWGYHGPRLALQPVIIWWALWGTNIIDWPFRSRHATDR
jgi:uncharacterized membrane protein